MNNEFFIKIGATVDGLVAGMKKASNSVAGLSSELGDVGEKIKKAVEGFDLFERGGVIFDKLNEATGGYADEVLKLGGAIKDSFGNLINSAKSSITGLVELFKNLKLAMISAKVATIALKSAIIATGIGALVVAVATLVAYWEDIKGWVLGVSGDLSRQRDIYDEILKNSQQRLDILNASDDLLKLQGKTQRQINDLKRKELKLNLQVKIAQLENLRVSLDSAKKQEKAYGKFAEFLVDSLTLPFRAVVKLIEIVGNKFIGLVQSLVQANKVFAESFDSIFGTDLSSKVDAFSNKLEGLKFPDLSKGINSTLDSFKKLITPDLTSNLEKDFEKLELEIAKVKNNIAKLDLKDIQLNLKSSIKGIDTDIATIKTKLANLRKIYEEETDFETRKANLKEQLAQEGLIIAKQYEKELLQAQTQGELKEQAETLALENKNARLIELQAKHSKRFNALVIGDSKKEIEAIKFAGKEATKAKLEALENEYGNLNLLSQEKQAEYNEKVAEIKRQGENASLLAQNEYWQDRIDTENIKGNELLEIQRIIEANSANIRNESQTKALTDLQQFFQSANELIESTKENLFGGIGEAIGSAFINGANIASSLGAVFLGAVGDVMVKYGKLAIAFGVTSEALQKTMQNPFGGGILAIGAGIALVAIGSAIKGFASNISSGGGFGGSSGGASSSSGGGVNSYGSSSTTTSGGFGGRVIFEIHGDKLIGVLNASQNSNLRVGDSDGLISTG